MLFSIVAIYDRLVLVILRQKGLKNTFSCNHIDTGYCQNSIELAKNADILIIDCAFKPGETSPVWPHLNPEIAAKIAQESRTNKLILTHFDASRYPTLKDRQKALSAARRIFPETQISTDGLQLEL